MNFIQKQVIRYAYKLAYKLHLVYSFIFRQHCEGSYVAIWYKGQILLIKNSYKTVYTLPCGGMKKGETPVETAQRELFEETSINLPLKDFKLEREIVSRYEYKKDHISLFEVHLDDPPLFQPDGTEVDWAGFETLENALKMPIFFPVMDYLNHKNNKIIKRGR